MSWTIRLSSAAVRTLDQLAPRVLPAIIEFLYGPLADNPRRVGKPLRDDFTGIHSARRGAYRVLYEISEDATRSSSPALPTAPMRTGRADRPRTGARSSSSVGADAVSGATIGPRVCDRFSYACSGGGEKLRAQRRPELRSGGARYVRAASKCGERFRPWAHGHPIQSQKHDLPELHLWA